MYLGKKCETSFQPQNHQDITAWFRGWKNCTSL